MDFDIFDLFNYLKDENYNKLDESLDYIIKNKLTIDNIDLNLKDENNNCLVNYIIIQNNYKLLEKLFKIENIKIDIFDSDNKSILYIPIKFNYKKIFSLLLEYNKNTIGVSICDIRDNNNNIALHYAIKYKNLQFIEDLLKNDSNTLYTDNNGNNSLHLSILSRNIEIINLILKYSEKTVIINSRTKIGETPLHYASNLQEIKIVKILLENGADINLQDYEHEYNILHYAINLGSKELVKICLNYNIDINRQDIFGNTPIHYAVIEGNNEIFNILLEQKQINCNLWNIDGKLPLHLFFKYSSNLKKEILDFLVNNTNLNIQDNNYESCLHLLCEFNIWENYENILKKKKLDILLKNKNDIRPVDYILKLKNDKKEKFIEIIVDSYLYLLETKGKIWENNWENICKSNLDLNFTDDEIKKLKNEEIKYNSKKSKKDNCKEFIKKKIEDIIFGDIKYDCYTKSFPIKRGRMCIKLDDIPENNMQFCTFTGSTLDVILGLIYLLNKHKESCSTIPYNFIENKQLCSTYNNSGIILSNKCEFLNFEIVWVFNNIHFIDNMEHLLDKCIYNNSKRFIIIPIGIELNQGSHANYLIIDKEICEIERFEPHGSGSPYGFNYNATLLDQILEKKFTELLDKKLKKPVKYIKPLDYLPKISLQLLDIMEKKKKKIGDPGGFCALWSIFYTDMRMTYKDIPRDKLIEYIINLIKEQNISYKNLIRNYAFKIINIRDTLLNKAKLDINDWLNEDFSKEQFDNLIKEIKDTINRIN